MCVQQGEIYVYFTINGVEGDYPKYTSGGGIYVYHLCDEDAHLLFEPESGLKNYCMASILCDPDGNLYYFNDSGHFFRICGSTVSPVEPEQVDLIPLRPAMPVQPTSAPVAPSSGVTEAHRLPAAAPSLVSGAHPIAAPTSQPESERIQAPHVEEMPDNESGAAHRQTQVEDPSPSINPLAVAGIAGAVVLLVAATYVLIKGARGRW